MSPTTMPRGFEHFTIGQVFTSGSCTVLADPIKACAQQFDPQAQHLDEADAAGTLFGTLVASGWQTASLTMRLMLESGLSGVGGRSLGLGVRELKWLLPVRPGDAIHAVSEVTELRASRSRPDRGIVVFHTVTSNQAGQAVMDMTSSLLTLRSDATP